jgi:hypothetical protein
MKGADIKMNKKSTNKDIITYKEILNILSKVFVK